MKKLFFIVTALLCLGMLSPLYAQKKKTVRKKKHTRTLFTPPVIRREEEIKEEALPPPIGDGPAISGPPDAPADLMPATVEVDDERGNSYSNNRILTAEDILVAHSTTGSMATGPVPNSLYIHTSNGTLLAYDNGLPVLKKRWKIKGEEQEITNGFSLLDNNIYLPSQDGKIWAINPATGKAFWDNRVGMAGKKRQLRGQTAGGDKGVVYVAGQNRELYAIDQQKGDLVWNYKLPYEWHLYPPYAAYGKVVVTSAPYVYCFEARSGKPLWNRNMNKAMYGAPVMDADRIYAPDESQAVYAFNTQTGATEWKFDMTDDKYSIGNNIILNGTTLFIANSNTNSGGTGTVYALNTTSGKVLWQVDIRQGAGIASLRFQDGKLMGSAAQTLFVLSAKDGKVMLKKELPEKPVSNILLIRDTYKYLTANGLASYSGKDAIPNTENIEDTGYTRGTLKWVDKQGMLIQ